MWADLQETFYLVLGPCILGLILPLFAAGGILIALLMATAWAWRPLDRTVMINRRNDADE